MFLVQKNWAGVIRKYRTQAVCFLLLFAKDTSEIWTTFLSVEYTTKMIYYNIRTEEKIPAHWKRHLQNPHTTFRYLLNNYLSLKKKKYKYQISFRKRIWQLSGLFSEDDPDRGVRKYARYLWRKEASHLDDGVRKGRGINRSLMWPCLSDLRECEALAHGQGINLSRKSVPL